MANVKNFFSKIAVLNRTHLFDPQHPLALYQKVPKPTSKPMLYFGWLSARNFGDDVIADICRRELEGFWLQSAYPRVRVEDVALGWLFGHNDCSAALIGGGTIIGSDIAGAINDKVASKTPIFSIGSGVPPLSAWTKPRQESWRQILQRQPHLSVRGERSKKRLQELFRFKDVEVVGDLALATSEYYPTNKLPTGRLEKPIVGINVGSHHFASDASHLEHVQAEVVTLLQKMGSQFRFVPVYLHQIDRIVTRQAFHRAGLEIQDELTLFRHPQQVRKLGNLDAMVSERLHGSILAHSYGVPSIGIAYHDKVEEHFEIMDQEEYAIPMDQLGEGILVRAVCQLLENRADSERQLTQRRIELRSMQKKFVAEIKSAAL